MYAPPERADLSLRHGRARDVWAFGCVLLEVLVLIAFGWETENIPHTCDPSTKHLYYETFGLSSWVEIFKEDRRRSAPSPESRTFADNIECVWKWRDAVLFLSPDHMFSKLVHATLWMLNTDPADRRTSEESLAFIRAKNWQEVEADILAVHPLPEDPPMPLKGDTEERMGRYTTEDLALIHDISLELIEGYVKVELKKEES